jgi:8-oxo-dGTP pyrophosphatase MutT (NUDIX family)
MGHVFFGEAGMKKGEEYTGITVSYFCHDGKGNFVLNKRSQNCRDEHGRWDNGGGGLDFGDGVEETLRKEIKEEYGAQVLAHEFLGYREAHREHDGKPTHWIALYFKVLVSHDEVKNCEPHKFDAVEWFRLDALPGPLHSMLPGALAEYKERLIK